MKLYVWKIPTQYGGYDVGYTRDMHLWVLAISLEKAKETVILKISESVYPHLLTIAMQKIVREISPFIYNEGDVGMF